MKPDCANYRTQDWGPIPLKEVALAFKPVRLAGGRSSKEDHEPWGLVLGPLAIHPVFHRLENDDPEARGLFRVSHANSGGAIADWDRIEIALGFAMEIAGLDWSGGRDEALEITARNRVAVEAAHKKWTELQFTPADELEKQP